MEHPSVGFAFPESRLVGKTYPLCTAAPENKTEEVSCLSAGRLLEIRKKCK